MSSPTQLEHFSLRRKMDIEYLVCEPLEEAGFINAFSTRGGGVSPLPEQALNMSLREDKKEYVEENRRRFLQALDCGPISLITGNQTHSDVCLVIEDPSLWLNKEPECDAMVGSLKNVLFGIQTADCLPVLIGDPLTGEIAAIHAGWRGTMARITERTINDFLKKRKVDPTRCRVALGPSACVDCYEVGADVVHAFEGQLPGSRVFFKNFKSNGKAHLDVRTANVHQLLSAGVPRHQIFVSSHCTIHQNGLFFSYRAEASGGAVVVGRQLSVIGRK